MNKNSIPPPVGKNTPTPKKNRIKDWWNRNIYPNDPAAFETRRLVAATWFLGAVTLAVVGIGLYQANITRKAIIDSDSTSAQQIRAILSQDAEIKRQADAAEKQLIISHNAIDSQKSSSLAQLIRSDSQISIAKDDEHRRLRAYVYVMREMSMLDNTDTFRSVFSVKNNGQTPAYHLTYWVRMALLPLNPLPKFNTMPVSGGDDPSEITMNPGSSQNPEIVSRIYLEKEDIDSINNLTSAIFIWGEINYKDAFGIPRHTQFRYRTLTRGYPFAGLESTKEWNEAN